MPQVIIEGIAEIVGTPRMSDSSAHLTTVSGAGAKGPACFVLEADGLRLMLDLGYGPQPGLLPNVDHVGKVDALLLSHGHNDHAGGLKLREKIGNPPVYATEIVARNLPPEIPVTPLPLQGTIDVLGVRVTTGRSGHAPGGIWIHLGLDGGLLYMGDNSCESLLYAWDRPPPANTLILDASYGDYESSLADCQKNLAPYFANDVLLPVPENGRGPEMALHLLQAGHALPHIDAAMRNTLQRLATVDRDCLQDGASELLSHIAADAPAISKPQGVMLASRADGMSGETARLIAQWEQQPDPAVVFTGYLPPGTAAERLTRSGRAQYLRWNVHPRLSDNVELVHKTGAKTVVPAFGDAKHVPAWQRAFAPAQILLNGTIHL
jgi:glyoxylase-like metal-dependent hydrolase (beta-lactamase superfamily II)